MGNYIFKRLLCRKEVRILSIGLDAAGKTTMLYKLKLGEVVTTIPTIGFNVETIVHNNINLTCWDVGLRDKSRPLIRHYLSGTGAVVFVVDSTDRERLDEAITDILRYVMVEDEIAGVPVLVLANKQDIAGAMTVAYVTDAIERSGMLRKHPWKVFGTVATTGDGLYESLDWLTVAISQGMKDNLIAKLDSEAGQSEKPTSDADKVRVGVKDQPKISYYSGMVEYVRSMFGWK